MNIAVLGTGMVGRGIAARLVGLGHHVTVGTRDVAETTARTEPSGMGTGPYAKWATAHPDIELATYDDAAAGADLVVNATLGQATLAALARVRADSVEGKVVLDLALPLDFSAGMPPRLLVANDDSLGEQVQRALPGARVVKALSTVYYEVMIDPTRVPGPHNLFVAGDDATAKSVVVGLLGELGWPAETVLDLGGIASARSAEMYMPLYFNLHQVLGTFDFNIAVVTG